CVVIRKGDRSRFVAPAFRASSRADVARLAKATHTWVRGLRGPGGGVGIDLADPSGIPLRVVAGVEELPELPRQQPLVFNAGGQGDPASGTQRPPRGAGRRERGR